jgi:hypothetical protein
MFDIDESGLPDQVKRPNLKYAKKKYVAAIAPPQGVPFFGYTTSATTTPSTSYMASAVSSK